MEAIAQLRSRLATLKAAEPRLRQRQLAARLGISEAELLTLDLGEKVVRLAGDWKELLPAIKQMGYVMALTRNEACVHERKGVYDNFTFYTGAHNMGVAVNPDIDLRLFMDEWAYGLAVTMPGRGGRELYSFQFFNARGEAVHKVFSTPKSDWAAYRELRDRYRSDEQEPISITDRTRPALPEEKPDHAIDVAGFQQAWRDLQDTHHFFSMLKKYGVTRTQALRLAPEGMVTPVDRLAVENVLTAAAESGVSIMCFVHSGGCIQIHTGPVKRLLWHGDWYNVMDPAFNLHLDTTAVAACYVVRKPTADGTVTSLELFDADGQLIVYFFGARKPGKPELAEWRTIVDTLPAAQDKAPTV
jgi:putative hemin transport protein